MVILLWIEAGDGSAEGGCDGAQGQRGELGAFQNLTAQIGHMDKASGDGSLGLLQIMEQLI